MSVSPSLASNPGLDTWLRLERPGTLVVRTGKAELGQGIASALARIAAEELDVSLERIRVEAPDTDSGPNEGITAGSMSMEHSGAALRQAAATARAYLLERAGARLEAAPAELRVEDGTVVAPGGGTVSYWELLYGGTFGVEVRDDAVPKRPAEYRVVGRPGPRIDLPGLVAGTTRFVQDLAPVGVLHARVLQPPSPAASLERVDEQRARALPGIVAVVRDGGFVGVVAEREEQALRALELLKAGARWREPETLPRRSQLAEWLERRPAQSFLVADGAPVEGPIPPDEPPDEAAVTVEGTFTRGFQMHASIGPSAALAEWRDGAVTVWTHSQAVPFLRLALAEALDVDPAAVRAVHVPGPGCYGHNGADDAAYEAVLLARAVPGRPVLLKWTREDEHTWEPYGPPAVVRTRASLDADGRLAYWSLEARGTTHNARPFPYGERTALAAAWRLRDAKPRQPATPLLLPEAGTHRNATPIYRVPRRRIVKHLVADAPLRTSSTRALGAYVNVFAIESLLDELAAAAGIDPLELRLSHLDDDRARDVLTAAAERAGWAARERGEFGRGMGIGFARYKNSSAYAAVVAAVRVDDETACITVERAVVAADAGQVVDPEGLANQLEGGVVQSTSWTLKEDVAFDETRVTSADWESYPILTFSEAPEIETVLVDRPGEPYLGAGEAAQGPTAAAIANAVRDAIGVRLYDIPFTPDRVRAAVAAL